MAYRRLRKITLHKRDFPLDLSLNTKTPQQPAGAFVFVYNGRTTILALIPTQCLFKGAVVSEAYRRTVEQLAWVASKFWPDDLSEQAAELSIIPKLIDTSRSLHQHFESPSSQHRRGF